MSGMNSLRRLARYLKGTANHGVWLPAGGDIDSLNVSSDTDWASCKKKRGRAAREGSSCGETASSAPTAGDCR